MKPQDCLPACLFAVASIVSPDRGIADTSNAQRAKEGSLGAEFVVAHDGTELGDPNPATSRLNYVEFGLLYERGLGGRGSAPASAHYVLALGRLGGVRGDETSGTVFAVGGGIGWRGCGGGTTCIGVRAVLSLHHAQYNLKHEEDTTVTSLFLEPSVTLDFGKRARWQVAVTPLTIKNTSPFEGPQKPGDSQQKTICGWSFGLTVFGRSQRHRSGPDNEMRNTGASLK